jgi:hypothetical protein
VVLVNPFLVTQFEKDRFVLSPVSFLDFFNPSQVLRMVKAYLGVFIDFDPCMRFYACGAVYMCL